MSLNIIIFQFNLKLPAINEQPFQILNGISQFFTIICRFIALPENFYTSFKYIQKTVFKLTFLMEIYLIKFYSWFYRTKRKLKKHLH